MFVMLISMQISHQQTNQTGEFQAGEERRLKFDLTQGGEPWIMMWSLTGLSLHIQHLKCTSDWRLIVGV